MKILQQTKIHQRKPWPYCVRAFIVFYNLCQLPTGNQPKNACVKLCSRKMRICKNLNIYIPIFSLIAIIRRLIFVLSSSSSSSSFFCQDMMKKNLADENNGHNRNENDVFIIGTDERHPSLICFHFCFSRVILSFVRRAAHKIFNKEKKQKQKIKTD